MLSDKEYAARHGIDLDSLTPEQAEFTFWSLEMDEARDPETHKLVCPNLRAFDCPLWEVKTRKVKPVMRDVRAEEDAQRAANLALYIARGYAFRDEQEEELEEVA